MWSPIVRNNHAHSVTQLVDQSDKVPPVSQTHRQPVSQRFCEAFLVHTCKLAFSAVPYPRLEGRFLTSDGLLDEETEKQTIYQETQTQLRRRETNLYIQTKIVTDVK